ARFEFPYRSSFSLDMHKRGAQFFLRARIMLARCADGYAQDCGRFFQRLVVFEDERGNLPLSLGERIDGCAEGFADFILNRGRRSDREMLGDRLEKQIDERGLALRVASRQADDAEQPRLKAR